MSLSSSPRVLLSRIGRRSRLAAALACLLLAAVTAVEDAGGAAAPTAADTRPLVVAARALPIGHTLTRADLTRARWPDRLTPPGSSPQPDVLVGRVLAGPLARGEPLTPRRLVDPALTAGLRPGTVAAPVDLDTDVRGLIGPGDRIDLLDAPRADDIGAAGSGGGSGGPGAERTAQDVRVLAVTRAPAGMAGDGGCRLVLAVARDVAVRIAGLRVSRVFTAVAAAP